MVKSLVGGYFPHPDRRSCHSSARKPNGKNRRTLNRKRRVRGEISKRLSAEQPVWNPVRDALSKWINAPQLGEVYRGKGAADSCS